MYLKCLYVERLNCFLRNSCLLVETGVNNKTKMKNAFIPQCSEITHFSYYKKIRKERLMYSDLRDFVLRKKINILEKQTNKLIQC